MKLCAACREEKEDSEFYRKGGRLQSKYKECQRAYYRLYYIRNEPRFISKNRRNKNRQRARLHALVLEAKRIAAGLSTRG
ncbi:MAG: hypothetical protein M3416_19830 [Acidobacteriota bacterium]|nr:hypothetical protein [Acidobacteriota bacterium]